MPGWCTGLRARQVDILFSGPADRADILRDGRADVGLLYAPYDDLDGLAHETLYVEDRVVIVPAGHRLAGHTSVRMSDLEGETLPRGKGIPQGDGTGPEVTDVVQMLQMITVSRMIGVLPRSPHRSRPASSASRWLTRRPAAWCSPGTSRTAGRWWPRS